MTFSESVPGQRRTGKPVRRRLLLGALACASLASIVGCNTSATIDGTVNYGGRPVEYGSISFEPKDTKLKKVVATIDDGRFEANDVTKGPTVIRISVGQHPAAKPGTLIHSAPSGTMVEISKSEKNISGGSQTLKFNLKGG